MIYPDGWRDFLKWVTLSEKKASVIHPGCNGNPVISRGSQGSYRIIILISPYSNT
jgi:hypothetical protein